MKDSKIETKEADANNLKRFPLDASFQGLNRSFVLAFNNTNNGNNKVERDSHKKYFLLRVGITNYNVLADGRNVCDQPINDQSKSMMKLERLQQEKETITQLVVYWIVNTSKIITN